MEKNRKVYDVGFMLSASKRRSYRESVIRMFDTYLRFLQGHGLTTRELLGHNETPDQNTSVTRADLTDEGWEFITIAQDKWFRAVDQGASPEDATLLEETLTRLRAKA